jgi:hypothetical protein
VYIPGLFLTGSRPESTSIDSDVYSFATISCL